MALDIWAGAQKGGTRLEIKSRRPTAEGTIAEMETSTGLELKLYTEVLVR